MSALKIEMVHDVVCSWCPIAYANLQQALNNLNIEANIHFLPYELNPEMDSQGEAINDHLKSRYQWNESKLSRYRNHLLNVAKKAGVGMNFTKRTHYYNTHKAHLLLHWSEASNNQQAMNEKLIDAYFQRGLNISDTQTLLNLTTELGLDRAGAKKALLSHKNNAQLELKKQRVEQLGLTGVPACIFNGNRLITGSNSVSYFEQVIKSFTQVPAYRQISHRELKH